MILERMNPLFPAKSRRFLMMISIFAGLLCLLFVRYSQDDTLKITWLFAMYACAMFCIISYKNSLNKYEVSIFCFLTIQLLAVAPDNPNNLDPLVSTSYLLSYRYGVSSRGFMATLVDFFTNGKFISGDFVLHFIFSSTFFISFVISVYLGAVIQSRKDDARFFIILLSILYLSCFTSPSAYYHQGNFGRVEIFALLVLFFIILIVDKPVIKWLIPFLAVIVLAIHLVLVFFYVPFIIVLLLYGMIKETKTNKRSVLLLITTLTFILTAFLWYLLFGKGTFIFGNAGAFNEYLKTKSDLNFSESFLHMTMFASLQDHLAGWKGNTGLLFVGNGSILINIPLILLFVIFWAKCFLAETQKQMKLFFLTPILILPYQALAFFMFFDFGRWMIMILNIQFMLFFYLVYTENKTVLSTIQAITPFVKQKTFFVMLGCLLMAFLGPVNPITASEKTTHIFSLLKNLIM